MFNFFCKIVQHPKINPGSAPEECFSLPQALFLTVTILNELNLLQDLDLYIHTDATAVKILSPLLIFSSTVPINERRTFLSTICSLDNKVLDCTDYDLTQTLLFGKAFQTSSNNFKIINPSIDYILLSKRFDDSLF